MHVLVHTQPGGVRGGGAALLMHKVASLHQALPALPPAMYFVFSRAWRTVKVNCAAHGARPSLDTPRHKSQRVFGLRNHDSQRLGSKECSVRRDCGFRHRRLGGSKAGPATQKLRAFFCTGPRRPAVHTARQIRGARPGTFYLNFVHVTVCRIRSIWKGRRYKATGTVQYSNAFSKQNTPRAAVGPPFLPCRSAEHAGCVHRLLPAHHDRWYDIP